MILMVKIDCNMWIVMIRIYDVKVFLEKHSICLRHDGSQSTDGAKAQFIGSKSDFCNRPK